MNHSFIFSVAGTPRPQPRPRFVKGRVVSTADPKAKLWRGAVDRAVREAIAHSGRAAPLFSGAVRVTCTFFFKPPASALSRIGTPHTHKPDGDNLAKACIDVMESAGVFKNDSQIARLEPIKWWGSRAGVSVLVEDMSEARGAMEGALDAAPDWLRPA